METVRFTEQVFRQPKDTARFRRDRIQLSREGKIHYACLQRPTMLETPMRIAALAAALFLAACQTAAPQIDNTPVSVDGVTFRMENPQRRAYERILIETRACEERNRPLLKANSEAELTSVCRCIDREFVDRLPEEFIRRHANEILGKPEPITARERSNLIARADTAAAGAYEACGWHYP